MTEEFDALLRFDPFRSIGLAVGILLLGILLEVGLRFLERRAVAKEQRRLSVIYNALHWQPLFWCVWYVVMSLLANFSDVSVERQRGLEVLWSLLLISITIVGVRILTGWVRLVTAQKPSASVSVLNYLVSGVAIVIVLLVILYALNISAPLLMLTFLGSTFGLSLAFREPLANLFAGVVLTVSQRLNPGDFVRLPSGEEGTVIDIEWDVTSIHQENESQIIVPNSYLTRAELINYDQPYSDYELKIPIGVSYNSDLENVERITIQVAEDVLRKIGDGSHEHPPYIRYKAFEDSDIKFSVYLRCQNYADRNRVRHEFLKQLHARYEQEGIVMPFPTLELHTPSGSAEGLTTPYSTKGNLQQDEVSGESDR